jgi:hypothetical protein
MGTELHDITFRFLSPHESPLVVDAIREAYGDSYDVAWCYDAEEIGARLGCGQMVSCGAFDSHGALLAHAALTRAHHDDHVVHAGQAVTLPAARGEHLFTRVKHHLADWAHGRGVLGIYSEATAAHPYSQRANLDLGAKETGFLLAWIPASVHNDAARSAPVRDSVALFYLATNQPHDHPVYVPERHREIVRTIVDSCHLRGRVADAAPGPVAGPTRTNTTIDPDHNSAIIGIRRPGHDLGDVVISTRDRLFARGLDVVYADLPLRSPATAHVGDALADAGFGFAGVFPSAHDEGEVMRLQSLNGIVVHAADVSVASDHGRALLDYVLADLAVTSRTCDTSRSTVAAR